MAEKSKLLKLKKIIKELEAYRGRHTELVTVYLPAGYNVNVLAKQIDSERSTAANIKSKTTRSNVISALEAITRFLKGVKKTPKNGLAIFVGNVSKKEGKTDLQTWIIEPPKPLNVKFYRCDQVFYLDPLKEMVATDEVYGLLVMDRKEATFGLLEGTSIKTLKDLSSGVPGKVKAGGQCLAEDTLIMKRNGEIIKIKDSHNPLIIISENFNSEKTEETPLISKWENKKQLFKITTYYPKIEIKSSLNHTFFIRTEKGIEEKPLFEIKEGNYLIMPEKLDLNLRDQEIIFFPKIKRERDMKKVSIPKRINPHFSKILGYYLGDGSYELDRLTFFEQREGVAEFYRNLIERTFNIDTKLIFREDKNYYQLRVYSRIIAQLFKEIFSDKNKTLNEKIPSIILKSSDESLAGFIAGFFDAEGYVVKTRVGLGIYNKYLARQLQFSLLRFGIISSLWPYDNKKNPYSDKPRYTISIDCIESLKKFKEKIGFCSKEKMDRLNKVVNKRSNINRIRQLVVNGREIARIIRNFGLNTTQFHCPLFFVNKRQMSKGVFKKRILDRIEDEDLRGRLELFYNSNLITVKIVKIEPLQEERTIDMETKNHNFIANCLVVHNSAARFARVTEGLAKEFYRRVAATAKTLFFDMEKLRGIIIGGPGHTKDEFLEEGNLVTSLKKKVIAVKDIGYTDESGLNLLVEAAKDVLAKTAITDEKEILNKFFKSLAKKPEMVAYGLEDVKKALKLGAAETLLISTDEFSSKKVDEFEEQTQGINAKISYISSDTEEGIQFKNLGGIGAILRFAVID